MKKLIYLCIVLLFSSGVFAQTRTITGTITDQKGAPIANASVVVQGTTRGTITRPDGSYSLDIPPSAKTIEFSFTGFVTQLVNIGARNVYSVTLESASRNLDEVVITGISRVKKSEFTGATTKIDQNQLMINR